MITKENDIGYPYNYSIEIKYKLQFHNQLIIETKPITTTITEAIPISDGWHLYFTLGSLINDCTLK
ncbi:MAG: aldose 1-epimerase [Saprospiraceae bacterium]|nr:aldose 1-epimerase [Candidatus Brachybacter algidus]